VNDSRYRNTIANYLSLSQRSAAVVETGLNSCDMGNMKTLDRLQDVTVRCGKAIFQTVSHKQIRHRWMHDNIKAV